MEIYWLPHLNNIYTDPHSLDQEDFNRLSLFNCNNSLRETLEIFINKFTEEEQELLNSLINSEDKSNSLIAYQIMLNK